MAGKIGAIGAAAVLLLLVLMVVARRLEGWQVWIPAMSAASACLVVACLWLSTTISAEGELALVPFASFSLQEVEVAESEGSRGLDRLSRLALIDNTGKIESLSARGQGRDQSRLFGLQLHDRFGDDYLNWSRTATDIRPRQSSAWLRGTRRVSSWALRTSAAARL